MSEGIKSLTQTASGNIDDILKGAQKGVRTVQANLEGGVNSSVKDEGDTKLFDKAAKKMDKMDFLNLLVTQMRYQDPMQPTENTEFVAQLAQFSSLENTTNMQTSMESLNKNIEALIGKQKDSADQMSNASATSLIGKMVRANQKEVRVGSTKKEIEFNIHRTSNEASYLQISDAKGDAVAVIEIPKDPESKVKWSGVDQRSKQAATAGIYTLKIVGSDGKGENGFAYMEGKVDSISFAKDGVRIGIGSQEIPFSAVEQVLAETTANSSGPVL